MWLLIAYVETKFRNIFSQQFHWLVKLWQVWFYFIKYLHTIRLRISASCIRSSTSARVSRLSIGRWILSGSVELSASITSTGWPPMLCVNASINTRFSRISSRNFLNISYVTRNIFVNTSSFGSIREQFTSAWGHNWISDLNRSSIICKLQIYSFFI